ncbi:plasmid stabilization protein [Rhizobium rhizosphaerae]|uniref:Plasmid stabilization protein n=1 Tax=Xaviernesmea rhizosphaerae TaxID=1672749 RepID=A0ABX3P9E3_9HYPH|nr:type II toxin-antitoxin system RelE/ParE family toxin [Xaviernesmea rhizosphaerae]OQP84252.1 plasmid stabilization protein [Xaviernesmea rhizosphaerae]
MIVVITDEAEADLEHIGDYIAANNPRRAETFVQELTERCLRLAEMPREYPLVPRYEQTGVRRRPYGDYVIFYRIGTETIDVLHVVHGAQDYEAILFPVV